MAAAVKEKDRETKPKVPDLSLSACVGSEPVAAAVAVGSEDGPS